MAKFQFTDTLVKSEYPGSFFMPTGSGPDRDNLLTVPVEQREEWANCDGKRVTITVEVEG